jgi:hypothetical protein
MKKNLLLFCCCFLLFTSCKKENKNISEESDELKIESIKNWYEKISKQSATRINSSKKSLKLKFEPNWKTVESTKIGNKFILKAEVETNFVNVLDEKTRYFLIITNSNNNNNEAKIISVNNHDIEKSNFNINELYSLAFFKSDEIESKLINTKINVFDLNFKRVNNLSFDRFGKNNPEENLNKQTLTTTNFCVNWFLVTTYYDSSGAITLITEEYLGQTCSSSTGNQETIDYIEDDGPNGGVDEAGKFLDAVSSFNQTGDQLSSSFISDNGPTERLYGYDWCIGSNAIAGWKIMSHETGTHKRVNNEWQWKSLAHNNISVDNLPQFISITVTENGSAIPTIGIYYAGITIRCNINVSAIFRGSPIGPRSQDVVQDSPVLYSNWP